MKNIAHEVMRFFRKLHAAQKCKCIGAPYVDHPAEVAGIMSPVVFNFPDASVFVEKIIAGMDIIKSLPSGVKFSSYMRSARVSSKVDRHP